MMLLDAILEISLAPEAWSWRGWCQGFPQALGPDVGGISLVGTRCVRNPTRLGLTQALHPWLHACDAFRHVCVRVHRARAACEGLGPYCTVRFAHLRENLFLVLYLTRLRYSEACFLP